MSAMKPASLWYPPQFPMQGRLPSRPEQVQQNIQRQQQLEDDYQDALSVAAGHPVEPPCCKTLHISLFFDGTGNNLNNDLYESGNAPHPTNIARLFRASIGDGYAGGTAHNEKAQRLTDEPGTGNGQYYKYYMPGVGTPFPEVGDFDYGTYGLAVAGYGEERINWSLLMIIDALRRALKLPRQDNDSLRAAVKAMGTTHGMEALSGSQNRKRQFITQFWPLVKPLEIAMRPNAGQCQLLGVKLYVYGFSRGAAAARAFVSWLHELLIPFGKTAYENPPALKMNNTVTLPITVEYLGLLDTVASVGAADIIPWAEGHQGWADGNQQLPDGELVKRCLHIVASHEQRLCFPLDSIRREDGRYPTNSVEVLHPGMHSDQGGGYPPGDQGKAIGEDDRLLLSQIALNDLYADAFGHGAPLKVPILALPLSRNHESWRGMDPEVVEEFGVSPILLNRFNAWRQVTLGLPPAEQPITDEQAIRYEPLSGSVPLEEALLTQMAWITAWRIDRYAGGSLKQTAFYQAATDDHADPAIRAEAEALRDSKHALIVADRKQQYANERGGGTVKKPMKPGFKDFDPDMARTQLREAAEEFAEHYRDRGPDALAIRLGRDKPTTPEAARQFEAAMTGGEWMTSQAQALVGRMFPPAKSLASERWRTYQDDVREACQPERLLRDLFDNQVHDSRAWFLYYMFLSLPIWSREPLGSYLRERMVFFGKTNSRKLAPYDRNGQALLPGDPRLQCIEQALPAQPAPMDAERKAEAQRSIAARWDAYHAQASEVNDAPA